MKLSELDRFVAPPLMLILGLIILAVLMLLMPLLEGASTSAFGDGSPRSSLLPR